MFLFFSKLLPLFFYPLGFASLMLLIALLTFWKRPRSAAIAIFIALLALLLPSNAWIANGLVRSLESQYLPAAIPTADAVVVLGGAVKPQTAPRPWIDVNEAGDRPIYAAQLYLQGKVPLIILSGGRIEWQGGGGTSSESADMAKLVEAMGVPATVILQDPTSLNTRENAVNVKKIMQDRGIQKILLVTSALHMPRSMAIFKKLGIEAIAAPTDFLVSNQDLKEPQGTPQAFILSLFPDSGNLERFTRALKEYVGLIIYRLRGWA
ncbi:MAG: YdcF family protein [Leptolyngbyaceae cyanobacterium CSU_1_4]|nr:YdcF family protein [Leptolyngbyaceae cyanobacterium CSU_1_4]